MEIGHLFVSIKIIHGMIKVVNNKEWALHSMKSKCNSLLMSFLSRSQKNIRIYDKDCRSVMTETAFDIH